MTPSTFGVNRETLGQTFDTVGGLCLISGEEVIIHWPEQEETRKIYIEVSVDHHGTAHNRGFFEIERFGVHLRIYLRDIQGRVSIVRRVMPAPIPPRESEIDGIF
jgi:hypothetical protein